MSNKFDELKKEIRDSMETLDEISDVFKKFGISPENPEVLNQLITDAGLNAEELNPERAAELVQKMTESLPPEMKKYMADMIESISGAITDLPMPDDVKRLMDSWKGGEEQGEETN
ncbi:MAG: hypothetical protein WAQ00_00175 [Tepidanaerobacteraceae bacterium]